jgi:hypothetical protein
MKAVALLSKFRFGWKGLHNQTFQLILLESKLHYKKFLTPVFHVVKTVIDVTAAKIS